MVNLIKILPANLVNQIAAGEVIERPSAIIKELVENSIDAGASEITIAINNGGKSLISIIDNGVGIQKDDLKLCLQAHATSKLSSENLLDVFTLGFRGEALASIASISKISISSKYFESKQGYSISAENGEIKDIEPSNVKAGTIIRVRDLFFSVPARLKFLRSDQVEATYCYNVVKRLALSNPRVHFKVENNGKKVFDYNCPNIAELQVIEGNNLSGGCEEDCKSQSRGQVESQISGKVNNNDVIFLKHRVAQIMGNEFLENAIYIDENQENLRLYGFISVPTYNKANSNDQYFMVNQRSLKDKTLTTVVKLAYGDTLTHGRYPCYALFLGIPTKEIDINVNPTKSEIRFRDIAFIRHIILNFVKNSISNKKTQSNNSTIANNLLQKSYSKTIKGNYGKGNSNLHLTSNNDREYNNAMVNRFQSNKQESREENISINEILSSFENQETSIQPEYHLGKALPLKEDILKVDNNFMKRNDKEIRQDVKEHCSDFSYEKSTYEDRLSAIRKENQFVDEYPLGFAKGQYHKNWIIAQNKDGLVIVDQHAAHERITHEKLKQQREDSKILRQVLLISEIIKIDAREQLILEVYKKKIEELGIVFDFFGNDTILIKELPAILGNPNIKVLFKDLIEDLSELEDSNTFNKKINDILARIACHSSIRSGKDLSLNEMNDLLRTMEKTINYGQCSHGRPTFITITLTDLEKLFGR